MAAEPGPIAIFVDGGDGHANRLARALRARGRVGVKTSLRAARFDALAPGGLAIPGFEAGPPKAALVRTIAAGSFEQVTLRLGALHALQARGAHLWNAAPAIERCVDKSATAFHLARAGLPTPPAWTCESPEAAAAIVAEHCKGGRALVLKPLFGAQGRGLRLIRAPADLADPPPEGGVFHLQAYVAADPPRDFRVLVAGGEAVARMARRGASWVTNIRRGARAEAIGPEPELDRLAVAAAAAVGADLAGVDLIAGPERLEILEVNSMPAWSALQKVTDGDIAEAIVARFLASLEAAD